ncbi:MAG TPA: nicotinate-nucleotide--dimethylbenzimidazole phosphoribosyltransferase [Kineosporiaceae bacterium]|nr:nicotinate-nucleotide--dimethylbenzimidazole phosphoribosyltransferase [Kineosporiaceae bacterium]
MTHLQRESPGEVPASLDRAVRAVRPADAAVIDQARARQDTLTKPRGSLGVLEDVAVRLAGIAGVCPPPVPASPAVAVFAADHGVHAQGVTPWPQEVTAQMVANFVAGGAAVNAFAAQLGARVVVVDVGVVSPVTSGPSLWSHHIRSGTRDLTVEPAMTRAEALAAMAAGVDVADRLVDEGADALLTGDMGIANTTASAALVVAFTGSPPEEATGRGTGVDDATLRRKVEAVRRGLDRSALTPGRASADPVGALAAVGGLEHAALAGFVLGGAARRVPVILDGLIAGAAALAAQALAPAGIDACLAGHRSAEPGHAPALRALGLRPLVDLDLRLGEGTGAVLALPLVQAAAAALRYMATFDAAGVVDKTDQPGTRRAGRSGQAGGA